MITIAVNNAPYITAHTLDAAGTILLAFRQLPPVGLTVAWVDKNYLVYIHPQHVDEPHQSGHLYRKRIIDVWKQIMQLQWEDGRSCITSPGT